MTRLLGLIESMGSSSTRTPGSLDQGMTAMVQDGTVFSLQPVPPFSPDLFLTALLRERNERVGNGSASGEGVFDFRYGPFTGGLGETGVMHLSTYGERILAVDIELASKHRGIEGALVGHGPESAIGIVQHVCGNFSFAHTHAFALALESIAGVSLSEHDRRLCAVAGELERLYNHLYAITRLAEAAAQHVLAAHLGALFEEILRLNGGLSGSRFLWGTRVPGGFASVEESSLDHLRRGVGEVAARFQRLYKQSLGSRNFLDRLHGIASVSRELAEARSLTGPSLRASGIAEDLRAADPLLDGFSPVIRDEGDSLARMEVRAEEVLCSCRIIDAQIDRIIAGVDGSGRADRDRVQEALSTATGRAVAAVEGPSGVIAWAINAEGGLVTNAYSSTPSLFGFQVFAEVLTGHIFTDFPFALDSFGLSFADAAR